MWNVQPRATGSSIDGLPVGSPGTWLVSGNHTSPLQVEPSDTLGDPDADPAYVWMVRDSVGSSSDQVVVPRVEITDAGAAHPGHFAYWASGEAARFPLHLADQVDEVDYTDQYQFASVDYTNPDSKQTARQLFRQWVDWRLLANGADYQQPGIAANLADPAYQNLFHKMTAAGDAEYVLSAQGTRNLGAAYTVDSASVMVDMTPPPNHKPPNFQLRRDINNKFSLVTGNGGIRIDNMTDAGEFIDYREGDFGGVQAYDLRSGGTVESGGTFQGNRYPQGPILTEFNLRFGFSRDSVEPQYLRLRFQVEAELWNLYNVTGGVSQWTHMLRIEGLPTVTISNGAGESVQVDLQAIMEHAFNPDDNGRGFSLARGGNRFAFEPGDILLFRTEATSATGPYLERKSDRLVWAGTPNDGVFDIRLRNPVDEDTFVELPLAGGGGAEMLEVTAPEVNALEVRMISNNGTTALYKFPETFEAFSFPRNSADTSFSFGYGYEMRDELPYFARMYDPRWALAADEFFQPLASSNYSAKPDFNDLTRIDAAGGAWFKALNAGSLRLFEPPVQGSANLAHFQHAPAKYSYSVGNPWGAHSDSAGARGTPGDNNALFDKSMDSSLPRVPSLVEPEKGYLRALPNNSIRLYVDEDNPVQAGVENKSNSTGLMDMYVPAENLLVGGGFNINSPSTKAWQAMLSGTTLTEWEYGANGSTGSTDLEHAFFRFPNTAQNLQTYTTDRTQLANPNVAFQQGVRELTEAEVLALGEAVAQAVRARSRPFYRLEEFINSGILHDILQPTPGSLGEQINGGLPENAPVYLNQADVLGSIAHLLTTRSDTFRIRAYGDSQNAESGEIEGQAWCEAIVQRVPTWHDASSVTDDGLSPAYNTIDYGQSKWGRRFIITSFRWLEEEEL